MNLKTVTTLHDSTYRVRFETTASTTDTELISDFGEPSISIGGYFYGDTVTFEATPSIGTTLTQGAAVGSYLYDGIVIRYSSTAFAAGALSSGINTITTAGNASFTLSANNKFIVTDFPVTTVFQDETQARLYIPVIEGRLISALETLRANVDDFSDEVIKTI